MKNVIIVEGPDHSARQELALALALELGGLFHHHSDYADVDDGAELATIYRRSFLPAFRGECDVVLDTCWISERARCETFNNLNRLGRHRETQIEHTLNHNALATVKVVLCLPDHERWLHNLADCATLQTEQLLYDWFAERRLVGLTSIPVFVLDTFTGEGPVLLARRTLDTMERG